MATNSVTATRKVRNDHWDTIIQPKVSWIHINVKELWRYRDLILLLIRRDFVAIYKQSVLGPLWFIMQPLISTLVYVIVFGNIARISTDELPKLLFYMSGIVMWNYFSSCLTKTSEVFVSNAQIFGKVYFPRLAIPISVVMTNLLTFAIQFGLFLIFLLFYYFEGANIKPNLWVLLLPLLILQIAALGLGLGVLISSLTTRYRDLAFAMGFAVQLWMYATPVIYPTSLIPSKAQWLYGLNPMAVIIETFRYAFLGTGSVKFWQLIISFGITGGLLLCGIMLFNRIEKNFMDTV